MILVLNFWQVFDVIRFPCYNNLRVVNVPEFFLSECPNKNASLAKQPVNPDSKGVSMQLDSLFFIIAT